MEFILSIHNGVYSRNASCSPTIYDKFEDAKRVMRNRKSKKAENSTAKRKKEKGQNTSQKTKD
jgi:hypothetical protein